jgi:hypothetical protein
VKRAAHEKARQKKRTLIEAPTAMTIVRTREAGSALATGAPAYPPTVAATIMRIA